MPSQKQTRLPPIDFSHKKGVDICIQNTRIWLFPSYINTIQLLTDVRDFFTAIFNQCCCNESRFITFRAHSEQREG